MLSLKELYYCLWQGRNKGSILIIGLWILTTLASIAIIMGGRLSSELKSVRSQRDRLKALYLAKAGIKSIIAEKKNDSIASADTFKEAWSNKIMSDGSFYFKEFSLGDGVVTVSYTFRESKLNSESVLYGMEDEQAKFNINTVIDEKNKKQFIELLKIVITGGDHSRAESLANALVDWIDTDDISLLSGSSEVTDYADLGYTPKNKPLSVLEEITLIKGFTPEILFGKYEMVDDIWTSVDFGIVDYVTIYGDGKININTTNREVLQALINVESDFSSEYSGLADKIFNNLDRDGIDGILGTEDDRFVTSDTIDALGLEAGSKERSLLDSLINKQYISFTTNTFRIKSTGLVNQTNRVIETVVKFESDKSPGFSYWHER